MLREVQLTERRELLSRHSTQADDAEELLQEVPRKAKPHCCMIRMNNSNKTFWDIFIIFAAIWNCVCIPLQIAFEPKFLDYDGIEALNSIIDVCFCLDVVACCRTTFYDTLSGDEVFDQKRCALKYIKSFQFVIDFISSIPLDTLSYIVTGTKNRGLQLFSLLKLVRISRIPKIIVKINVSEYSKNVLKLGQLILMVFIYLHLMGCIWFYIADQDKLWGPDQIEVALFHSIYDDSPEDQYWQSFYSSVILLVGKDISPINKTQVFFVVFSLMFGALLNANIFGNIALLASEIRKKQTALAEVIDTSNTAMRSIYLNQELTVKIISYIWCNSEMIFLHQELQEFLDAVSVGLQTRVLRFMFHQALKENQLVSDDFSQLLIANVKIMLLGPEETIIRQNDAAGDIFIIQKGECVVLVNDSMYVKTLYPGMIFGECASLLQSTRTATVKTESFLILGRVNQGYFTELINRDAAMHSKFVQNMETYQDFFKSQKKHFIQSIECLQSCSPQQIETIYQSAQTLTYQADETIWSYGDKLTQLYILLSGSVETYLRSQTDEILSLDLLSEPGSIFNQTFSEQGINYSLKCVRKCSFLVLSRYHLTIAPNNILLDYQIKRPNLDDFGQPFVFDARKTLVKAISKVLKVIKSKQVRRLQALFNFVNRMHTEAADQSRELIKANYFLGLVSSRLEKRVKFVSPVTRLQNTVQNCDYKLAQVMDLLQDLDGSGCLESRHRFDTPEQLVDMNSSQLILTYDVQQLQRLGVQQSMSELDYSYELDRLASLIETQNPAKRNDHQQLHRISEVELQFESSAKQLLIKPR